VLYNESQYDELVEKVANGWFLFGVRFTDGLAYDLLTIHSPGSDVYQLNDMIKGVYLEKALLAEGFSAEKTEGLILAAAMPNFIILGDLGDAENGANHNATGYALALAALMGCFMPLVIYGKYIATSVVNEKSSKTVEILFTCAKPTDIIFGKVFGVGVAVLTQAAIVVASFCVSAAILNNPIMTVVFSGSAQAPVAISVFVYVFLFFVLAFFSYSFLFAGFGAMSKDPQDTNNVIIIPTLLSIAGFYVSLFFSIQNLAGGIGEHIMKIGSFVPFLSPMIMTSRVCIAHVPFYETLAAIIVDIATLVFAGVISSKIYQKFIMLYGQKFSLRSLFSKV
jgi:ABC-2 type transport system permease protein